MKVRVEVSGYEEVREALRNGGRVVADKIKGALALKADQIISMSRPLVPVSPEDGGQLQQSLRKGRPYYSAGTGVVSQAVIVGGSPTNEPGHAYNIYAVLQEYDVGKNAPFHHTTGEAHFLERPALAVAPSIPDALLDAIEPADLGGA